MLNSEIPDDPESLGSDSVYDSSINDSVNCEIPSEYQAQIMELQITVNLGLDSGSDLFDSLGNDSVTQTSQP